MPPYTTISFEFAKRDCEHLVSQFCAMFLDEEITFAGVLAWGCEPDMAFNDIVDWNQGKLDSNFSLGYTQDVSHNYRQILLNVRPFSTCRIFPMNLEASIEFHCIIPEDEITVSNCEPILKACRRTWSRLPVLAIETYREIDSNVGCRTIKSGHPPSASLFAFVEHDCSQHEYCRDFDLTQLDRGYLLMKKNA